MKSNTLTSRLFAGLMLLALVVTLATSFSVNTRVFADGDGMTLDELMNGETQPTTTQAPSNSGHSSNDDVINDIATGLDHSKMNSEVVDKVGGQINYYAGIVIQILAYIITAALTISKLLDIMYIAIPLSRKWLANGYMGNAAAGGTPANGMAAGGGMGGMGMGMGGSRYGMGGMGAMGAMNGMNGMNAMGGGMGPMADNRMAAQNQPATGRHQFVSNAALNAVATESVVGTDGKGQSAWKLYFADMLVSLIATGVLIVLCVTGVVSKLGFMLGNFIGDVIRNINL